jgi:hypothetical protein
MGRGGGGGQGTNLSKPLWSSGKTKALDVGGPRPSLKGSILFLESPSRGGTEFGRFYLFLGLNRKQRSCDGQGGAQRPVLCVNELKKTGARSARVCMRGQNPLVVHSHLSLPCVKYSVPTLLTCVHLFHSWWPRVQFHLRPRARSTSGFTLPWRAYQSQQPSWTSSLDYGRTRSETTVLGRLFYESW